MRNLNLSTYQLFLALMTLCICTTCAPSINIQPPDVEIVYQSKDRDHKTLGFISADGVDSTIMILDFYANRPIWSKDGKDILTLRTWGDDEYGEVDIAITRGGQIVRFFDGNKMSICKNSNLTGVTHMEPAGDPEDHQLLIVNSAIQIVSFDYVKCEEVKKYVDIEGGQEGSIEGASLSSDGRQLVYTQASPFGAENIDYVIKLMDTESLQMRELGSGLHPSWSPDDLWIAYLGWDGIRMMTPNGTEDRLLVALDSTIARPNGLAFMTTSPIPQWSPDGKWLVYHKCTNESKDCEYVKDFSIFKLEISTGHEFLLLENGAYPNWKEN